MHKKFSQLSNNDDVVLIEELTFKRIDLWKNKKILLKNEAPGEYVCLKSTNQKPATSEVVLTEEELNLFEIDLQPICMKASKSISTPITFDPSDALLNVELQTLNELLKKQSENLLQNSALQKSYKILCKDIVIQHSNQTHYNFNSFFELFTSNLIQWFYDNFSSITDYSSLFSSESLVVKLNLYLAFLFAIKPLLMLFFRNFPDSIFFSSKLYSTINYFIQKIYKNRGLYSQPKSNRQRYLIGNIADKNFLLELDKNNASLEKELAIPTEDPSTRI